MDRFIQYFYFTNLHGCLLRMEIFTGFCDTHVNLLDFSFRLFPATTKFNLATHVPLVARKVLLMLLEAIKRRNEVLITHCRKSINTEINADRSGRGRYWLFNLLLQLDRGEPLTTK